MKPLLFAFFGTDEFSLKVLETLAKQNLKPVFVVTASDKPQGRKKIVTPPPVKIWATKNNIPFIQPLSLKNLNDLEKNFFETKNCELFIVASYGKIIPKTILGIPPQGVLNIHPSLLPQYRGPSPLESAILDGMAETGVSIMQIDEEMDHGPILAQKKISLADQYTFEKLRDESAILGAELLIDILADYRAGNLKPKEQNHDLATYTKKFTKLDGLLDLKDPAITNYRKILAFNPWPSAYFIDQHNGQEIKVSVRKALLENGELIFLRVVPEGHKEMSWSDYLRGRR